MLNASLHAYDVLSRDLSLVATELSCGSLFGMGIMKEHKPQTIRRAGIAPTRKKQPLRAI
ncbi:hypothetical protein SESBI_45691 [Sesbania bispinosa]|nr:hypothetical protein SESBI_45691 [Sesbania bispinosa]